MYANGLALFILAWLALPGIWLARQPWALNPKLWFSMLVVNTILFSLLGILFKMFPWFIDPRVNF